MRRILWFRRDLRADDQPLLSQEGEVLPIFIFDPAILTNLSADDRRITFIFRTLLRLKHELQQMGRDIAIFYGHPTEVFAWLLKQTHYDEVSASGDYDAYAIERDRQISHLMEFKFIPDTYIFTPNEVLKPDGKPYLVFTPFYNRAKMLFTPSHMHRSIPSAQTLVEFDYEALHRIDGEIHTTAPLTIESIGFTPALLLPHQLQNPQDKLADFASRLASYKDERDILALDSTSQLGIDLRFGTISIREVLRWLRDQKKEGCETEPFFRQLIFREFYAMLLYHYPHLAWENFRYRFTGIADKEKFDTFCEGRTGIPIIDAGIRQLLETGEMHNRVRMITASFFTKNLLLPWQWGEAFFAHHLMDYDAASNILSWQWSAGTGVDPQPYFRIFNPYIQTKKYDANGNYIYRWLPELKSLDTKFLYSEELLKSHTLPKYAKPVVSFKESSQRALGHFKTML